MTTSACFEQNTEAPESPEAFYIELKANKYFFSSLIKVVKVQNIVIKVCVHMLFIEMLLAVQRKLLAADGTYPPVRLHVLVRNCFAQSVAGRSPHTGDTAYEHQV